MKIYFRVSKAIIILLFLVSLSYSQFIKVDGGMFAVTDRYTLPEFILSYCIYDMNDNCILGGDKDAKDFYEWNYFTAKKGRYRIVIKKENTVYINEIVEVK